MAPGSTRWLELDKNSAISIGFPIEPQRLQVIWKASSYVTNGPLMVGRQCADCCYCACGVSLFLQTAVPCD